MIPRAAPERVATTAALAIVAAMTAAVASVILIKMRNAAHWAALTNLVAGLGAAIILVLIGRSAGLSRYIALGAVIAVGSLAIAAFAADLETTFIRQFGYMGILLTVTGLVTMAKYLHAPPRTTQ